MGFVDRGGGREAKGSSLRQSKSNPGAPTTKKKSANKNYTTPTTRTTPKPPPVCLPVLKALVAPASVEEAEREEETASLTVARFEKALAAVRSAAEAGGSPYMDAAVGLLSRKLEADQENIFRRAVEEGRLAAMVCWCSEVERQSLLLSTCVQHNKLCRGALEKQQRSAAGGDSRHVHFKMDGVVAASPTPAATSSSSSKAGILLYAVLGIHVNSIDRVNMRLHDQWIKELEANVKDGDVVGVLTGLNLSREHGTHYAQERLFKECWRVAAEVRLPLVLHLGAADAASLTETVNRAAKLLSELLAETADGTSAAPPAAVLHNGVRALHASTAMQQLVRAHRPGVGSAAAVPFYVLATADGLAVARTEGGKREVTAPAERGGPSVEALAALLPPRARILSHADHAATSSSGEGAPVHLSQLLIGTDAPWGTPQNLPDPYLCTLPNEPGNYAYVVQTIFDAMQPPPPAAAAAELTPADLSAIAAVNHLRVFFHECIVMQQQQPAVVAGLTDSDAKRALEALLAEAAKEREQMEQERLREEAALAQARSDELQERRSKRGKKKNVKANNRSNFTHFRNKDFAPRPSKQGPLTHQRDVAGILEGGSSDPDACERTPSSSSAASDSDSDGVGEPSSLAAQVERLLAANATHRDAERTAQRQPAGQSKGKVKKALAGLRQAGNGQQQQHGADADADADSKVKNESLSDSNDGKGSSEAGEADDAAGQTMQARAHHSRRQRKRQKKWHQQLSRGGDDGDTSDGDE
ncbi:hypothetical protein, conserved [Leishmania tarentolae]|uniref:TatD related DNase n=1 Tax=Leishmania tarentolae TaxID=5689 RepID=A0A640KDJ2_LEITA|nr:hypothetical protein, conserved [Leishmania tarentolae]